MPGYKSEYLSLTDCLRKQVEAGGVRALYRGLVPNMLKAVPSLSLSYVVFEHAKRALTPLPPPPPSYAR